MLEIAPEGEHCLLVALRISMEKANLVGAADPNSLGFKLVSGSVQAEDVFHPLSCGEGLHDFRAVEIDDVHLWAVGIGALNQEVFQVEITVIDAMVMHESDCAACPDGNFMLQGLCPLGRRVTKAENDRDEVFRTRDLFRDQFAPIKGPPDSMMQGSNDLYGRDSALPYLFSDQELPEGSRPKEEGVPQETAQEPPSAIPTDDIAMVLPAVRAEDPKSVPSGTARINLAFFEDLAHLLKPHALEPFQELGIDKDLGLVFPDQVKMVLHRSLSHSSLAPSFLR